MKRISGKTIITLNINDRDIETAVYPFQTLLDVLRRELGHTGSKPGCENGDCGACTIIWDGLPMKSCLVLAVEAEGHKIRTIEGLRNTPIQEAFAKNFAMQCGYCTPGFIMVGQSLLENHPQPDDYTLETWLQSNICRCTSYEEIGQALRQTIKGQQKQ